MDDCGGGGGGGDGGGKGGGGMQSQHGFTNTDNSKWN